MGLVMQLAKAVAMTVAVAVAVATSQRGPQVSGTGAATVRCQLHASLLLRLWAESVVWQQRQRQPQ